MTPRSQLQQMRDEISARQERYWDDEVKRCAGMGVILVEGDDDRTALEAMLNTADVTWPTRAAVVVAGSRDKVMRRLVNTFPAALGLVDRDVWTDAEAATEAARFAGRLYITPGWCLENTLLAVRGAGDAPDLDAELERGRDAWVRAGALWWTLQRTQDAFGVWRRQLDWTYGALRPDLDLATSHGLITCLEARIPEEMMRAARLDIGQIGAAYHARLQEISSWAPGEQWLRGVRGKSVFGAVLVPWLNQRRGQRDSRAWLIERARALTLPPPFDAMLARVR